MTRIFLFIFLF
ncbi:hypothetical protein HYV44_01905 [Candidatus Microgenomates bacterium]|nr:hypothetical protein [Candidatus Microgenomates bacterium]